MKVALFQFYRKVVDLEILAMLFGTKVIPFKVAFIGFVETFFRLLTDIFLRLRGSARFLWLSS